MIPAAEALERLRAGNLRFAANVRGSDAFVSHTRRVELASGQQPFAIILGCSDSRVPAEIVFDQGLGDLFVIRVAGNIVAPSQVGSVEFAASRYSTRLVVVMGHTQGGDVLATLAEWQGARPPMAPALHSRVCSHPAAGRIRTSFFMSWCAPTCARPRITCDMGRSCW